MHLALIKTSAGFVPADNDTHEAHGKLKLGSVVHGEFKRMRRYGYHKKFFALLNYAFENWQPGEIDSKYGVPEKNFDQFREDLIILAGYYEVRIRLDGTTRIKAKSMSFANMDQDEFENLYNNVLNVILKKVNLLNTMTAEQVNKIVDALIAFG